MQEVRNEYEDLIVELVNRHSRYYIIRGNSDSLVQTSLTTVDPCLWQKFKDRADDPKNSCNDDDHIVDSHLTLCDLPSEHLQMQDDRDDHADQKAEYTTDQGSNLLERWECDREDDRNHCDQDAE